MKTPLVAFAATAMLVTACQTQSRWGITTQFQDLPANVQSTVRNQIGDSRIVDIDVERRTGNRVYEVTYLDGDREQKLHVREDGAILGIDEAGGIMTEAAGSERLRERGFEAQAGTRFESRTGADFNALPDANVQIGTRFRDLPASVQQTIKREAAGAEIADIDKETRTGRVVYEVTLRQSGRNPKIHIAEDGTLLTEREASLLISGDRNGRERIETRQQGRGGAEFRAGSEIGQESAGAERRFKGDAAGADYTTGKTEIRFSALPRNVQTTIRQHGESADIATIKKTVIYEIKFKDPAKGLLRIAEDGTVIEETR